MGVGVDEDELERVLPRYFDGQVQASGDEVVTIDGKTMRGTLPSGRGVHLLAAYQPQEGVVLMQVEVGAKENENSAAPKRLDLRGKVVIGDAMHTQREVSKEIVRAGGDYVWTAKGNQAGVEETIRHRTGHAARVMATINHLVLALIHKQGAPSIPAARRKFAARFIEALNLIL